MKVLVNKNMRTGAALLVVLIIVMVICVMSMSFLTHSNVQMVCGQNTILRMQMDYLADSGLVYAKTNLLYPQEVSTSPDGYWTGETVQIEAGDDYCYIEVSRSAAGATNRCTYDIRSEAYRDAGGEKVAQSNLNAQLRLDPCIGYWAGASGNIPNTVTVNGDVYCNGDLTTSSTVNGDVFANSITGVKTGQLYSIADCDVSFPNIGIEYFSPVYDYDGVFYWPESLASEDCNCPEPFSADVSNPAGVVYRGGNLLLRGGAIIDGTLVVDGNLTIQGPGNVIITSAKKYPGLVVNGTITVEASANVTVNGLVQTNAMSVAGDAGNIDIVGTLFVRDSSLNVNPAYSGQVNIVIAPMISAVKLSSQGGGEIKWSPAGGAFFKYIRRN